MIGWGKKETLKNTNCKWHLEKEKEYEELPVASISADTWRRETSHTIRPTLVHSTLNNLIEAATNSWQLDTLVDPFL